MTSYYLNEAAFDLLDGPFVDKTIHGLEAKLPGDETLAVFVHRRPIEAGASLRGLVDDNIALNKKRLLAYAVLSESEASIGGSPGMVLRTRWRSGSTVYTQLQAHVAREGTLLIFAVSAPIDEQTACDETFDSILQTITWRTD